MSLARSSRRGLVPAGRKPTQSWLVAAIVAAWCSTALAQGIAPRPLAGGVLAAPPAATTKDEPTVPATDLEDGQELLDRADRLVARGKVDEALALVSGRPSADPVAAVIGAWADQRAGRDGKARDRLEAAAKADPLGDAALELGLLLGRLGDRAAADALLTPIAELPDALATPFTFFRAARAARALRQSRLADGYFREASDALPGVPRVEAEWGELFHTAHNDVDAAKSFAHALEADADYVPAHVGLARALADTDPPAAAASARKALEIDPASVEARLVLAELALDRRRTDEAGQHVAAALAVNPRSGAALALRAGLAAVQGRTADFEADVRAALALNPLDADAYTVPSELMAAHYRFEEAVELSRKAVAIDPDNSRARAALGLQLMRTGDEQAARTHLDAAFALDPFNEVTFNLLTLLDKLQRFETRRDGDLVFRFDPEDAPILAELAPAVAAEAMASLSKRYGFRPAGPILVELFPVHDDFAVRTLGLPGMLGALGACFGRVVTLDSPRARPPGSFHWGATLWHELAHVFTLQMSRQRVPRWLTEGVSVYEERLARPQWGRESEFAFLRTLDAPGAIPLASLNDGFTDPRRIALAYQQASLVVEFLVGRFGDAGLHRLLRAYGEGLDDGAAMQKAMETDLAALQPDFDTFLDQRYGAMRRALRVPEGLDVDTLDAASLPRAADEHAGSFPLQMAAGQAAAGAGQFADAKRYFERAAALVPIATGENGPRVLLAKAAVEAGDAQSAYAALEAELGSDGEALEAARLLAEVASRESAPARAVPAHQRIADLVPFEGASQSALGRAALAAGEAGQALLRFRLALAANPDDLVGARTDHAEALLANGQATEARRELLTALESAPLYDRAQDLLLAIVDGGKRVERRR